MPVIKSAKKQMLKSFKRRIMRQPIKTELKTLMKKELKLIKDGKKDEAVKFLSEVYSEIDMACKKHIIHSNNADRKKSRLAQALNSIQAAKEVKEVKEAKKEEKK